MFNILIAKSHQLSVDFDAMPEVSKRYLIEYGIRQKLNDVGAAVTKDEVPDEAQRLAQKVSLAEAALAALMRGDISVRKAAAKPTRLEAILLRELRTAWKKLSGKSPEGVSREEMLEALSLKVQKSVSHVEAALRVKAERLLALEEEASNITLEL